jgi:hypothetical protein
MRQETNNEMDLLLRRLSRRQGVPASDGDSRIDSDHLDVDELSSYAENALPAAARARYTEHLAECSRCREVVVQLSASVPVVTARETVTVAEPSGLRKFLASFFSPMVLRYAVPALGLVVVAAIGFVVFRPDRQGVYMAQREGYTQSKPAQVQSEQPAPSGFSGSAAPGNSQSPGVIAERKPEATKETQQAPVTAPESAPEPKKNEPAPPAERQEVASATPQPPAPTPGATVDEMRVNVETRRANESARVGQTGDLAKQKASEDVREREKKEDAPTAQRAARAPAASPQAGGSATFSVAEADKDRNRDDGVIRSAGGRRFRKQNGVWVDTAYDSGSQIMTVGRGSEAFRTLVADEPTIKTIADELDGTIIVVWKGRTYRIR